MAPLPKFTGPLFPPPPSTVFAEDATLKRAVATARDDLKAARSGQTPPFRLAIIDLTGDTLKWGGHDQDTMDYIASEAKIIALYAAFALRDLVRRFAALLPKAAKGAKSVSLFGALRAQIDPGILASANPSLIVDKESALPKYQNMFVAPPHCIPEFTGSYRNSLQGMIVPSNNNNAMECIHGVGFAYINGAMKQALLFKDGVGPWLAGDFLGKYTPVRINTANDQGSAQAGTALSMAKLMAIIVKKGVSLDGAAFSDMQSVLQQAVNGIDRPYLTRNPPDFNNDALRIPLNKITNIKLGWGYLKRGSSVGSEVWHLEGLLNPAKSYAVSYQNLDWTTSKSEDVAFMIRKAIWIYEGSTGTRPDVDNSP
jgi:hypothetical protein